VTVGRCSVIGVRRWVHPVRANTPPESFQDRDTPDHPLLIDLVYLEAAPDPVEEGDRELAAEVLRNSHRPRKMQRG